MPLPDFDLSLAILLGTVLVGGIARGMSGFGTGMIVVPVAAALYGPKAALVIVVLIDTLPIIPVTIPALKIARWREVLPVLAGLSLLLPVGIQILKWGDPTMLRWLICVAILLCATALVKGWRYAGPRTTVTSLLVGSVAGLLSGIASIPGPPVIIYWLASHLPRLIVRANLMALFFLTEALSIANIWVAGLFERQAVLLSIAAAGPYFVGLLIGSRLFGLANDKIYRRVTFVLIAAAALLALPAADPLFAALGRPVAD